MSRIRSALITTALAVSLLLSTGMESCDAPPPPAIEILSPVNGAMIDAPTVLVSGTTNQGGAVLVNNNTVTVNPDLTWEIDLPLDQAGVLNPIDALFLARGILTADKITVLAGPSVAEGAFSPEGVGALVSPVPASIHSFPWCRPWRAMRWTSAACS